MAIFNKINLKLAIICLILVSLQIALFSSFDSIAFNLPFSFILVTASLLPLYESFVVASLFCILSSLLVYDLSIFWTYPLVAFIASKLNPSQIANKLIVCVAFNIVFTPIFELIYAHEICSMIHNLRAILANLIVSVFLFLITKIIFKK